jgi:ribosomal protein S16
MKDPAIIKIHGDKLNEWLGKGAAVSEAARAILRKEGFLKSPSTAN